MMMVDGWIDCEASLWNKVSLRYVGQSKVMPSEQKDSGEETGVWMFPSRVKRQSFSLRSNNTSSDLTLASNTTLKL